MNQASEQRLAELKQRIEQGEYEIDPRAVADAIIDRLHGVAVAAAYAREHQNECSNPESSPSASVKTMPAGPGRTRPTQANRWLARAVKALGGMQTQSS